MPQVIAERYELVELLGSGGMGAVWRARDRMLDREVAIKEVALPAGMDEEQRERVHARTFREARSAARLDHPGIVTVYDVVEHEGRPWIVMQLVRAPALDRVISREGALPPARVAAIGADVLDALRAAHAAGVVHRDVKPGNVLLPHNRAVLTDFGIATVAGDETLTQTGAIVGSPAYLAPELARHQRASPASDLWSLGATLYAAVEGRPPYQRQDVWGVMAAVLNDDPDPMSQAGPLQPVLEGLLRKDPEQRLRPEDAIRQLRQIAQDTPQAAWAPPAVGGPPVRDVTLPPTPPPPTMESPPRRSNAQRWAILIPAGVLTAVLVAAAIAFIAFVSDGDDPGARNSPGAASPNTSGGTTASRQPQTNAPAGFQTYSGSFAAAVPQGWKQEQTGRNVSFTDPDGAATRGIFFQHLANTTGGEATHLSNAAQKFENDSGYTDYKQVAWRENIPFQDGKAAEFEFTFNKSGKAGRCRVRVFSYNGALYMAFLVSGQHNWQDSNTKFETFLSTFRRP
ncbi:serine/threonine-protein kinase [Actinomadura rudentiformis]|uniref:non-specific serine/threonine protein kinase n=1 Tax=Actinomadura rudentiformis TaxID=359158 RepID=A0A6H9YFG2_9ACTN|nr:serine/threonine-protein kinase [Actinomadura rudentiformis]KAB2343369.1 serine/threonine protein kinase [Actinomadura rudentiformis]